ncbi:hypothetical protein DICSQDRAFT_170833 [Dichomitus squalens LYAD-421 SS1]|uniref:DUF6533 domain-containing protein n=1 Tax=Dichomitus squalens (strain LYAD-421) TaxID=732165 RepID=R7SXN8_DICSQ|nr:uncharacterized protein DICSQDRAFT_170833 [Dichomitus squalens LYAD-421 SS1]EJF60683.1 hypothetical protein DICSQDRAFT_170833 [Dichomitus squalens LYAD-421 SS1]
MSPTTLGGLDASSLSYVLLRSLRRWQFPQLPLGMNDSYEDVIRETYSIMQVENYCIMASTALLWLDWALMFTVEVPRIWRRKFTGATVVYLLNRYTALFERVMFILEALSWDMSDHGCGGLTHIDDALLALNYLAFAVETISTVTTVMSEGIFLALTWIRTYGIKRDCSRLGVHAPLTTLLLRDGTAYFVTLFPSKAVSIVSSLTDSPSTFLRVWPYFDEVLTVCFLCRFLLDLRGIYFSDGVENELEGSMHLSNVNFSTANVIGNLGATSMTPFHCSGFQDDSDGDGVYDVDSPDYEDGEDDEEQPQFRSDPFKDGIEVPSNMRHRLSY